MIGQDGEDEEEGEGNVAEAQLAGRMTTETGLPTADSEPVTFNSRQRQKRNLRGKSTAPEQSD